MHIYLANYVLDEQLYMGKYTLLYKGKRIKDGQRVIVKALRHDNPSFAHVQQLRHEYKILQKLKTNYVNRPYGFEELPHGKYALIYEDIGGEALSKLIEKRKIDIATFLRLMSGIAQGLGEIHHQQIVHKDIKPHNIIVNIETGQIKIIDFGISTQLTRETRQPSNPESFQGSLAYISPEQTGRTNRAVDYRTDIYSLGVVMYETLTNRLPFEDKDAMELIYDQICQTPLAPIQIIPFLPKVLSDITMKCLEKNAEERYHSSFGIKKDLDICYRQIKNQGYIDKFIPGQEDPYDFFHLSQKLYGREEEIKTLLQAFERVTKGKSEVLLVSGYSGVGKTSVIHEIHKPVVYQKGYFISGKYEQHNKNGPYSALIIALQDLVNQLLSENQEELTHWKERLQKIAGINGQLFVEIIPQIELIIGPQPPLQKLDAQSTENRFHYSIKAFIEEFLKDKRPLVVFLDDMQWADGPSLKLLQFFLSDITHENLLFIGAYRDNEVDEQHPFARTIDNIQKSGCSVSFLKIKPLSLLAMQQWIGETFQSPESELPAITSLIYRKTQGNPFFTAQFLKILYENKLLDYDVVKQCWSAHIPLIQQMHVTDNVAEFMLSKIQKLPAKTQSLLKIGAAVGHTFDLQILAKLQGVSLLEAAKNLWPAVQEELIMPQFATYLFETDSITAEEEQKPYLLMFQHDRIQQAAYLLVNPQERVMLHYNIGQILLQMTEKDKIAENSITIVNQLNYGLQNAKTEELKLEIAKLNKLAGERAHDSAAFSSAIQYFSTALSLLPSDPWQTHYDLAFSLHENLAACELSIGEHAKANEHFEVIIKQGRTLLETNKAYSLKLRYYSVVGEFAEAVKCGFTALDKVGVRIKVPKTAFGKRLAYLGLYMRPYFYNPQALLKLPQTHDPQALFIMHIYSAMALPLFYTGSELFFVAMLDYVDYTVKHGTCEYSTLGFSGLGLCCTMERIQNYELAYQIGNIGGTHGAKYPKATTSRQARCAFYCYLFYWKEHLREGPLNLKLLERECFEAGIISYAGGVLSHICSQLLQTGDPLGYVEMEIQRSRQQAIKYKTAGPIIATTITLEVCQAIQGLTDDPTDPLPKEYEKFIKSNPQGKGLQPGELILYFKYYIWRSYLLYHHGKFAETLAIGDKIAPIQDFAPSNCLWLIYYFYQALALAAYYPHSATPSKDRALLKKYLVRIKKWAKASPVNFLHKYYLLAAEIASLQGQKDALDLYEKAASGAAENHFIQDEALAYELMAKFYLKMDKIKLAGFALSQALHAYSAWGAEAKVAFLKTEYADLLQYTLIPTEGPSYISNQPADMTTDWSHSSASTNSSGNYFDILSIMQASQTLSEEIYLDRLLEKLMHIIAVNAGADKAFLILNKSNEWFVYAELDKSKEQHVSLSKAPLYAMDKHLSIAIVHYVQRTQREVLLNNATSEGSFIHEKYIEISKVQSVLCLPLLHQKHLIGILYMENRLNSGVFVPAHVRVLNFLCSQMAISIINAQFYEELEEKVAIRTHTLKQIQTQLAQQEKLAFLGNLSSGIAHEIKNPLNFVINFSELSENLIAELGELCKGVKNNFPGVQTSNMEGLILAIKNNNLSILEQGKRVEAIVEKMIELSSTKLDEFAPTPIIPLINSCIETVIHEHARLYPALRVAIKKEFDLSLEKVEIAAGVIDRVLKKILNNAFYALWQKQKTDATFKPELIISTKNLGTHYEIKIHDNGTGMSEETKQKIFSPFFTTKHSGEGSGLSLSLSYHFITQLHQGTLAFNTNEGEFSEFIIKLPVKQTSSS